MVHNLPKPTKNKEAVVKNSNDNIMTSVIKVSLLCKNTN